MPRRYVRVLMQSLSATYSIYLSDEGGHGVVVRLVTDLFDSAG